MNGDTLRAKLEAAMMSALDSVNKIGLTGEKNEQGPLWPAKEIVALFEKVSDYLAERDGKKSSGDMGSALGGDRQ